MPWQRAAQSQLPRPAAPVPVGESVRLAALQATWKRDRQVARRRLWWRWTVWGARRYFVPVVAGLSLFAGLWFAAKATLAWLDAPEPSAPAVIAAPATVIPRPPASDQPPAAIAESHLKPVKPQRPITLVVPSGMAMGFDAEWTDPAARPNPSAPTPVSSATLTDAATISNPQLIPENWLHSKEP